MSEPCEMGPCRMESCKRPQPGALQNLGLEWPPPPPVRSVNPASAACDSPPMQRQYCNHALDQGAHCQPELRVDRRGHVRCHARRGKTRTARDAARPMEFGVRAAIRHTALRAQAIHPHLLATRRSSSLPQQETLCSQPPDLLDESRVLAQVGGVLAQIGIGEERCRWNRRRNRRRDGRA